MIDRRFEEARMKGSGFRTVMRICACLVLVATLAGCGAAEPVRRRFFWPPLPERPRIEWLGVYTSQFDFPKEGMAKLVTGIIGETDAMTFEKPLDIHSDGEGKVYVSDPGVRGVYVYDMKKHTVHLIGTDKGGEALFVRPTAITLDDAGNLYVSDADKKEILVFDKDDRLIRTFSVSEKMNSVGGIAFDNLKRRLICTDVRAHKIVVYDQMGNFLFSFGERGDEDGKFNFPGPVTMNGKGEIL